ncbi:FKBP-type peptidyl-prolyl cis-trans isomerase [Winogradskyella tangerina]|uniref:FKBP-type peptidyl-prolyl cis-trans isomerase n=1 Tax=Winogradskyella tangerina TaxID=2023240 RepID=UPI000DBE2EE1|nr:hypothetical protein [Winogradskyella tangerina]
MTLKTFRKYLPLLLFISILIACSGDDDNFSPVPDRDRTEQQLADKDSLENYLRGHYYNSSLFETQTNLTIDDIIITEMPVDENGDYLTIPPDPANNTRLWDAVEVKTTTYEDAEYEYYILRLNQGGGESPEFTDQVRVVYEGFLETTSDVFDEVATPVELSMQGIPGIGGTGGVIRGWQLILSDFNTASSFNINNGIVEYDDYGLGVMFIPSGLGYFSTPVPNVPSYSNLIFKFELLQFEVNDHDLDGIPSYIEDVNENLNVLDDNSDEDGLPDYFDTDDDDDDVPTLDELVPATYTVDTNMGEPEPVLGENEFELNRSESNGVITINTVTMVDANSNGVFDHLDSEVTTNYNEEDE